MGNIKQINIKNGTYYFLMIWSFNDMNWRLWFKLTKINKKSYKNIGIYNIGYIAVKQIDDYENIHSLNPLYLMIGKVDSIIEEKNGSKYLVFDSTDQNKKVFKK